MIKKALVIPYFGEWPKWFDLYLYSLGKNPSLDVLFFTDIPINNLLFIPSNAKFIKISFKDYCKEASEKLGMNINFPTPYKLCDLKPFYPIIHHELLKSYDYIGWGDIDLIYGDLENFFPPSMIEKYDIISTHSYIFSGHFTLVKNNSLVYDNFVNVPNWKELLLDSTYHGIDEIGLSYYLTPNLKYTRYIYDKSGGFVGRHRHWAVFLMQLSAKLLYPQYYLKELWTTPIPDYKNAFIYKNGCVFDNREKELPYIHFYYFKKPNNYKTMEKRWEDDFYHLDNCNINNDITIRIDKNGIRCSGQ